MLSFSSWVILPAPSAPCWLVISLRWSWYSILSSLSSSCRSFHCWRAYVSCALRDRSFVIPLVARWSLPVIRPSEVILRFDPSTSSAIALVMRLVAWRCRILSSRALRISLISFWRNRLAPVTTPSAPEKRYLSLPSSVSLLSNAWARRALR